MTARRWVGIAAIIALILIGGRLVSGVVVDHRWFAALGAGPLAVWKTRVTDLVALRVVLSILGTAFLFANLYGVTSSVESLVLPRRLGDLEIGEKVAGRELLWSAALLSALLGVALSFLVDDWMSFDLVAFARPFGVPEPYTGADLSFFTYWLPLESALYLWGIVGLLAAATLVVALYAITTGLGWESGRLRTTRHVRRHLTALAAGLLLVLAWGHRLDAYGLLTRGSGADSAFVLIDHTIELRSRFVLASLTALAAIVVLSAGWSGNGRVTFWVVTAVLVATVVLRGLVPLIGARVLATPDLARRNAPYLANRAAVTQTAYGVNRLVRVPGYGPLDVSRLAATVPLWDPPVLARAIERERRGEIVADDIGWQSLGGRLGAVAVTRPVPPGEGDPVSWGVVSIAGSSADPLGAPARVDAAGNVVGGIGPPEAAGRDRRLVVFPQATGSALVSDTARRVLGDSVESLWSRLLHAWDERDFRLLFSRQLDRLESPKIVLRRGVRERMQAVAPFFVQGHAITPLLVRDTLYWTVHLYAASESFPLSQRYKVAGENWGYYQYAGIGILNAETGAVRVLAAPSPDRLTEAWIQRFPKLFASAASLPAALVEALPPPTDGVLLQALALARYGSRGDVVSGAVHLPSAENGDSTLTVAARALALLPGVGADSASLVPGWTIALLDASDRVAGVLVALGGATPTTLWVPSAQVGPRWGEVLDRLRRPAPSTPELGEGREVARGRVRVLPLSDRVAYVQPVYALRAGGQATALGAAALVGDSLRAGHGIADALGAAPALADPLAAVPGPMPVVAPTRIRQLYDAMRAALKRGDWAAFGAAFDSLGSAVGRGGVP